MTFPVYFHIFGLKLHPHPVMEFIAFAGGFQLYLRYRHRWPKAAPAGDALIWIFSAGIIGALAGAKILAWAESAVWRDVHHADLIALLEGKTIVGGLLGAWLAIEIAKKCLRITHSTGDQFTFPLIFGMAVGRIGCFLTGLSDDTYGTPTHLPWGIDFGDGIPRHPTQLYDILFLILLAIALRLRMTRPYANGQLFKWFLASYLAYRFFVEFIKPDFPTFAGLSAIQWACVLGLLAMLIIKLRRRTPETLPATSAATL